MAAEAGLNTFCALRYQPSFHGVDLSALRGAAVDEYFRQPIVVSNLFHMHVQDFNKVMTQMSKMSSIDVFRNETCVTVDLFPLQDTFDIRILMAKSVKYTVNFLDAKEEDLYRCVSSLMCTYAQACGCLVINEPLLLCSQDRDSL